MNGKGDADEVFVYFTSEIDVEWKIGRFIIHMECMRDNLPEADFEEQENWVFNYHASNVPTFTSEVSSLHSML